MEGCIFGETKGLMGYVARKSVVGGSWPGLHLKMYIRAKYTHIQSNLVNSKSSGPDISNKQ